MQWLKRLFQIRNKTGLKNGDTPPGGESPEFDNRIERCLASKKRGNEWLDEGRLEEAEDCYRQALSIDPAYAEGYVALGYVLAEQNRLGEAEQWLREGLALNPQMEDAFFILGRIALANEMLNDAIEHFERAVALRPDFSEAVYLLGCTCRGQFKLIKKDGDTGLAKDLLEKAEQCFREVLAEGSQSGEAYCNLGCVLADQGRFEEAREMLHKGLSLNPGIGEAHYVLGAIAASLQKLEEAVTHLEKAISVQPDLWDAYDVLNAIYFVNGFREQGFNCYRRLLAVNPNFPLAYSNMLLYLQYDPNISSEDLFAEHKRFAEIFETPLKVGWLPHSNGRDPDRRLRVGYLSPDFRLHSVAFFILPILRDHDRRGFEIWCYHDHMDHDDTTEEIANIADHFVPCKALSDEQLAERIRTDEIDILVDLAGHFGDNRLLVFARKPAPIQVTWIGYPSTTGLSAMDYRLTDGLLEPPGMTDRYHSEILVRLPQGASFEPMAESPPVNELPALASAEFTFGNLNNNLLKMNGRVISVWARILAALPQARLIIGNMNYDYGRLRLLSAFAREGIDPDRLVFYPRMPLLEYLALHHRIDLALDPFPYNGGTTSLHSLWMGVPMITLEGKSTPSRAGYMLMQTVGLPEFIATSEEEYVQRAVRWAGNLPRLNQVRQELRGRLSANLIDKPSAPLVRDVEKAFRDMWKTWVGVE